MSDTRHIEYARADRALWRCNLAIAQLQSARSEISVTAGEQRKAVRDLDEALLAARRAASDIEHALRMIGAGVSR